MLTEEDQRRHIEPNPGRPSVHPAGRLPGLRARGVDEDAIKGMTVGVPAGLAGGGMSGPVERTGGPRGGLPGRVLADMYPLQSQTPLEEVRTFERFVGGFAGNVATGLARLGVPTAILSGVGDDGHGRFIRAACRGGGRRPLASRSTPAADGAGLLRGVAARPLPDHAYRFPSCPDWEIAHRDLPRAMLMAAPLALSRAWRSPSDPAGTTALAALDAASQRSLGTTILDLDWRPGYWHRARAYPGLCALPPRRRRVIGSESEFEAARLDPAALAPGPSQVLLKHGPAGPRAHRDGRHEEPGLPVPVVNGLGAGDAFAAALGAGLLRGLPLAELLATRTPPAPSSPPGSPARRRCPPGTRWSGWHATPRAGSETSTHERADRRLRSHRPVHGGPTALG